MRGRTGIARIAPFLLPVLASACDRGPAPGDPVARPGLTSVVRFAPPAQDAVALVGTVEARYAVDLGFRAAGRMVSRDVEVGDVVGRGRTLASLDPTVARLTLAAARANLANAEALSGNAAATLARQQELFRSGSLSQAQLDLAVEARATAQAAVRQAGAALDKARTEASYTSLVSGTDAVVAAWKAEVGQVVAPAQPVVRLVRPDERDAVFDVRSRWLDVVRSSPAVTVSLLADPAVTARASLREVVPRSDAATQATRVRLTLNDAGPAFRLGALVRAKIGRAGPPAIYVPQTAILDENGAHYAWLVGSGGVLARREVAVAAAPNGQVSVLSGLQAGDRILTAGVHEARDGQRLRADAPAGAAP